MAKWFAISNLSSLRQLLKRARLLRVPTFRVSDWESSSSSPLFDASPGLLIVEERPKLILTAKPFSSTWCALFREHIKSSKVVHVVGKLAHAR